MKKLLMLALTVTMTLGLATVSSASTAYMDVMVDGKQDSTYNNYDLSQFSLGVDMPFEEFKLGCNINSGIIKKGQLGYDYDTSSVYVKGGFALIDDPQLRLDLTGGFYDRETEAYDSDNKRFPTLAQYSLMLGLDAKIMLNEQAWIDLSYAYGLDPKYDVQYDGPRSRYYDTYALDAIALMSCKVNILINEQFGVAVGYTDEIIDYKSIKDHYRGATLGGFIRF